VLPSTRRFSSPLVHDSCCRCSCVVVQFEWQKCHVTGNTNASDFPALGPWRTSFHAGTDPHCDGYCSDAFVAKLAPDVNGFLAASVYLGGSKRDSGNATGYLSPHTWAMPPSTQRSIPVMNELSSEARKTAAAVTSSALPKRPMGIWEVAKFANWVTSSFVKPDFPNIGVSIGPGLMAFTRILRSLRSEVQDLAKERTAALLALYTLKPPIPF
jgi:hypothetical protein